MLSGYHMVVFRSFWMSVPGPVYCRSLPSKLEQRGSMPLRRQAWPNIARWSSWNIVVYVCFTATARCLLSSSTDQSIIIITS